MREKPLSEDAEMEMSHQSWMKKHKKKMKTWRKQDNNKKKGKSKPAVYR